MMSPGHSRYCLHCQRFGIRTGRGKVGKPVQSTWPHTCSLFFVLPHSGLWQVCTFPQQNCHTHFSCSAQNTQKSGRSTPANTPVQLHNPAFRTEEYSNTLIQGETAQKRSLPGKDAQRQKAEGTPNQQCTIFRNRNVFRAVSKEMG